MLYGLLILILFIICFMFIVIYKLSDPKWYHQFYTNEFTDKDCFTRIVKFLMKE